MLLASGCREETKEVKTSTSTVKYYTEPEQAINASLNEEFTITLDSKYQWVNYDNSMLKLVDSGEENTGFSLEGEYVVKWFKFKPLKNGETEIVITSIEGVQLPDKLFVVNIK
jgi:hypothetical protein